MDQLNLQPVVFREPLAQAPQAGGKGRGDLAAARKAAKDFESILLNRLMEEMQRTVGDSGLLDSPVTEQMQGIFWFYLSQELADCGGLGLWKDIYRQMTAQIGQPMEGQP